MREREREREKEKERERERESVESVCVTGGGRKKLCKGNTCKESLCSEGEVILKSNKYVVVYDVITMKS